MNMTILSGRLTRDAELSYIGVNKTPKAKFSLAVERAYQKDKDNKVVDYIDMEILGARAESLAKYLVKGKMILVHGELNIDKYQNDKGETRSATKVKVDRLEFLSSNINQNQPVVNETSNKSKTSETERVGLTDKKEADYIPLDDDDIPF